MNEHTLKVLEFFNFLDLLKEYAVSESGKELITKIKPQSLQSQAFQMTELYRTMLEIRQSKDNELPAAEFYSPEIILVKLKPQGSTLDLLEIHVLARLMKISENVRKFVTREVYKDSQAFTKLAMGLTNFSELLKEFGEIFDESGEVKDNASPILSMLRPVVRQLEEKILNRLRKILKGDDGTLFQDDVITRRNNRFVLQVKREAKGKIQGIVHDESSTGRTLFLEPQQLISDGNEMVSTLKDIDNEIRRILSGICEKLRQLINEIDKAFKALTRYDVAYAVSAWAADYNANFTTIGANFDLRQARHPILQRKFRMEKREEKLFPLDFTLKNEKVVAITGSNTGGKTVSLKTLGLITLMHQSGFPLPVKIGSSLPFFDAVYADIGDEQSLEQSLSTFSGHVKNISEILSQTQNKKSLVLLDELGSGTDPIEGGALGCAIIETLAQREVMTVLTTHLSMIKIFIQENENMINAAVRFNRDTLQPEYILDIGLPGASHALFIAEKLSLPSSLISRARNFLNDDTLKLENVLEKLDHSQRTLNQHVEKANFDREKISKERELLENELKTLKNRRLTLLQEAQKEAESLVENARKEMEKIINALKTTGKIPEDLNEIRSKVLKKRDNLREAIQKSVVKPAKNFTPENLKIGDRVWIPRIHNHGIIKNISADFKKLQVDVDGLPVSLKITELELADALPVPKKNIHQEIRLHYKRNAVGLELNLIGKRLEDALIELEKYLDSAMSAGLDKVRIVHGRGEGKLRQGIHQYLKNQSYIAKFSCPTGENSPGDSVTDIWL